MSGFHEVRLEVARALGATVSIERRVDVVALANGREARNVPWAHGRRRFDVGGIVMSAQALSELSAFFEARAGKLYGFRFRDPLDWKSCGLEESVSPFDQSVGAGDGSVTTFQLIKSYGAAPYLVSRPITKPAPGSVRVAVAGVELSSNAFAVDETSGLVSLSFAPALDAAVSAGFEFDTPVRFDVDRLDIALEAVNAGRVLSAPLIEIIA